MRAKGAKGAKGQREPTVVDEDELRKLMKPRAKHHDEPIDIPKEGRGLLCNLWKTHAKDVLGVRYGPRPDTSSLYNSSRLFPEATSNAE